MIFELPLAIRQGASIDQDWNYPVRKAVLLSIREFAFLLCVRGEQKKPSQIIICKGLISLVRPARFERTAFSSGG